MINNSIKAAIKIRQKYNRVQLQINELKYKQRKANDASYIARNKLLTLVGLDLYRFNILDSLKINLGDDIQNVETDKRLILRGFIVEQLKEFDLTVYDTKFLETIGATQEQRFYSDLKKEYQKSRAAHQTLIQAGSETLALGVLAKFNISEEDDIKYTKKVQANQFRGMLYEVCQQVRFNNDNVIKWQHIGNKLRLA